MQNCIVFAAEKQEEIKTWLKKAFQNQWTLMMNQQKVAKAAADAAAAAGRPLPAAGVPGQMPAVAGQSLADM